MKVTRLVLAIVIAFVVGFFGLSLLFSDLGPGETFTSRVIIAIVAYFITGLAIGWLVPRAWLIAALAAWGSALLGIFTLLTNTLGALVTLLASLAPALVGGALGAAIANEQSRRASRRSSRKSKPRKSGK